MMKQKRPVLVFGAGLTVLGVIRRLTKAGFMPFVVTDPGDVVRRSRYFRGPPAPHPTANLGMNLREYLDRLPFECAVLMPCSDDWVLAISKAQHDVKPRFLASVAPADVLERLVDKWHLAKTMETAGLPHPLTIPLDATTDLDAIPDWLVASAFIKPRDSLRFQRRFAVKGFVVNSRAEIAERLSATAGTGLELQLQEYIPGPPDAHVFVDGFAERDGHIAGLFVRRRLRMYPRDFGNSTYMESIERNEAPDAVDTVTRLLGCVGYRGVFSAELKRDARDGTYRLLEVNVRPWWYVEFAAQCGVDVCAMAVRDALSEEVLPPEPYAVGWRCVNPYYDYFACAELHAERGLSLAYWAGAWMTSTQATFRWSDPWPGVVGAFEIVRGRLARSRKDQKAPETVTQKETEPLSQLASGRATSTAAPASLRTR